MPKEQATSKIQQLFVFVDIIHVSIISMFLYFGYVNVVNMVGCSDDGVPIRCKTRRSLSFQSDMSVALVYMQYYLTSRCSQ